MKNTQDEITESFSLVLNATSLTSGAGYAKGISDGMGGGGSLNSTDPAQRNEYRYENREQLRNGGDLPSMH